MIIKHLNNKPLQVKQSRSDNYRSPSGLLLAFISFLLLLSLHTSAQLEQSHWRWVDSNYANFSVVPPQFSSLTSITYNGNNMPSCMADKNGYLLFCASGGQIRDKNNNLMAGNSNYNPLGYPYGYDRYSTQIVPWPCNDSLYFIINYNQNLPLDTNNVNYSIVNINANNGLGEVSSLQDVIDSNSVLQFEIARHGNNRDFWLLVLDELDPRTIRSYLISDTGISLTPVVNTFGPLIPGAGTGNADLLVSPDGTKLVLNAGTSINSNPFPSPFWLCDFNNMTGTMQYICPLEDTVASIDTTIHSFATFSPNSRFLYYSWTKAIVQLDLEYANYDSIQNSKYTVHYSSISGKFTDVQLATDGVIYCSAGSNAFMHVIPFPDKKGAACGFVKDSITLGQQSKFWLPKMISNLHVARSIAHDSIGCTGDTLHTYFDKEIFLDSAHWYIGSISSPQQFFVSDTSAALIVDSAGIYPIQAISYSGCQIDTFYDTVTVLLTPAPNLGPDTILCEGDTIAISNDWAYSYLWNTGDTTDGIQIMLPDTYWLELSNYCGVARDTVIVDSIIEALVIFPALDTLLCLGDTLHLDASVDQGTYTWHDGSTDSVFAAFAADTVWATAVNACGTSSDTISVRFTDVPMLPLLDSILCVGDTQFINLVTDSLSSFLWYSGDNIGFDTITNENHYWVQETNLCGSDVDTFFVAFVNPPVIDLGADTVFCGNSALTLNASTRFGSYAWSSGDSTESFTTNASFFDANDSVSVFVTVSNACTSVEDSILLVADFPLLTDLGNDTVVCVNAEVFLQPFGSLPAGQAGAPPSGNRVSYVWNNQSTMDSGPWTITSDTTISVSVTNTCGMYNDAINIVKDDTLKPDLGNDSVLCFGDTVVLRPLSFPSTGSGQAALDRVEFLWEIDNAYSGAIVLDSARTDQQLEVIAGSSFLPRAGNTTYSVHVQNTCETASTSVTYQVDSLPELLSFDSLRFCHGAEVEFKIDKDDIDSLRWGDGTATFSKVFATEKRWRIAYFNHCGSSSEYLYVIRQYPPRINVVSPMLLCEDEVLLEPSIQQSRFEQFYDWSDGSVAAYTYADKVGTYRITVTDEFGCADSAKILVNSCGKEFYAPNSFTPDGDLLNNTWDIKTEVLDDYEIQIYDRWGNNIFTFRKGDGGWDGTSKGQELPPGVYQWIMTASTENYQRSLEYTGMIVLIR